SFSSGKVRLQRSGSEGQPSPYYFHPLSLRGDLNRIFGVLARGQGTSGVIVESVDPVALQVVEANVVRARFDLPPRGAGGDACVERGGGGVLEVSDAEGCSGGDGEGRGETAAAMVEYPDDGGDRGGHKPQRMEARLRRVRETAHNGIGEHLRSDREDDNQQRADREHRAGP